MGFPIFNAVEQMADDRIAPRGAVEGAHKAFEQWFVEPGGGLDLPAHFGPSFRRFGEGNRRSGRLRIHDDGCLLQRGWSPMIGKSGGTVLPTMAGEGPPPTVMLVTARKVVVGGLASVLTVCAVVSHGLATSEEHTPYNRSTAFKQVRAF